jgi:uncharacterized membrane protein YphA (DoxX/SURF4 family)
MRYLGIFARIVVATTFIFSGFVKLVDPLGSSYKFQEYFGSDVLGLEFLIPYALPFSILLIIAELMFGLFLLIGFKPKLTVWSLLLLSALFLFLTWYSAYFDKVTDCGCFGDAITLTPWATFYKNIVLTILVLVLLFELKNIKSLFSATLLKWISFLALVACLYITYHVLIHLPLIDFRPYAVGKSIPEGMTFIGDKDPPIHDFYLESVEGDEVTSKVLEADKMMLIISYNLSKSPEKGLDKLGNLGKQAENSGYEVFMLSASMEEDFEVLKQQHDFNFKMLFCDETALKTIIRSNPGIVLLNKGTVTGKYSWTDIDRITF